MTQPPASPLLDDILAQPRFQEPPGWRWHKFTTSGGYKIRYGSVHPKNSIADAVVVCLPGFRDFSEQYLELAHTMLERNMAFWVIDWRGQGDSDRFLKNRHKRHSAGYEADVRDLHELVDGYILPSAVHPDVGRLPLIMLGHSMGGHIGMRFLHDCNISSKGKQAFSAAAFCAPMFGVNPVDSLPLTLTWLLSGLMCMLPSSYVPRHGRDWAPGYRDVPALSGKFSHDPIRQQLQDAWFKKSPSLQVGGPTNRWLFETLKSCLKLNNPKYLKDINLPILMAMAGNDRIVSNRLIQMAAMHLPQGVLSEIPGAEHEILMESDQYRQKFLDHFFSFVSENVLKKLDRGMTKF
jgi:lysophospholipase